MDYWPLDPIDTDVPAAPAGIDVDLVPSAPPSRDSGPIDVTLVNVTDPAPSLEHLRRSRRFWLAAALAGGTAFVVVAVVSCVQFTGTFITCQLLAEARQEATKLQAESEQTWKENQRISAEFRTSVAELRASERDLFLAHSKWNVYERQIVERLLRADDQMDQRGAVIRDIRDVLGTDLNRMRAEAVEVLREEAATQKTSLETLIFLVHYLVSQGVDPRTAEPIPVTPGGNPFLAPEAKEAPEK